MNSKLYFEESVRPTLYRGLKYWGKKPHNIWRQLIERYTTKGDIVYDPFAGSALTFFESLKIGRKPIVADINPLTLFLVELYSYEFDQEKINLLSNQIIQEVQSTDIYKKNYIQRCVQCNKEVKVYNYRWGQGRAEYLSYRCSHCNKIFTIPNNTEVYEKSFGMWKPSFCLELLTSVTSGLINKIGGNNISDLWTKRNIEILSFIFDRICRIESIEKVALMFGFLQILHLTTKMCALRGNKANRPLSTSWGRPAFLGLSSFMEQNPLVQFERAIYGKTGVLSCLKSRSEYLPKYTFSTDIRDLSKVDGIVLLQDAKTIKPNFLAKLLITDPPYGSIIQYGELSLIWNIWLHKYNSKYKFSLDDEIIVNKRKTHGKYVRDMIAVWRKASKVLTEDANIIVTYNSNNEEDWKALQQIFDTTGLCIRNRIIQKNRRSSEANVASTKGIGITDYYFILERVKRKKYGY